MTHGCKGAVFGIAGGILVASRRHSGGGHGSAPRASGTMTVNSDDRGRERANRFGLASNHEPVGDVVTWTNVTGPLNVVLLAETASRLGTQTVLQARWAATWARRSPVPVAAPNATYTSRSPGSKPVLQVSTN